MDLVMSTVEFDGPLPTMAAIAAQVATISGVPTVVTDDTGGEADSLHVLHAFLAFDGMPESRIKVFAQDAAALQQWHRQHRDALGLPTQSQPVTDAVARPHEVRVDGPVLQEPTLHMVTLLAMEALGGRIRDGMDDEERRQYSTPITLDELKRRERVVARQGGLGCIFTMLMMPIVVPLWLIWIPFKIIWSIWKAYPVYRKFVEKQNQM